MSEVVILEEISCESGDGIIQKWTINRPSKLNALNQEVTNAIKSLCKEVENRPDVRLIIITGSPPLPAEEGKRQKPVSFIAGADITEFAGKNSTEIEQLFRDNAIEAIWNLSVPTIAMVDGFALGGGCEVACSCDIRLASTRSKFGTPEVTLGLIPGYGGTQRLSHLLGYGKAMELILSGEHIDAEEALKIGLVNHIYECEHLEEETLKLAHIIANKSSNTIKIAKATVRAAFENTLKKGIEIEAEAFANIFDTKDAQIGVSAFIERKQPEWQHK